MHLLVTRPEPQAARTAQALRARGHDVTIAPVLRIESIIDATLGGGPWAAVVMTSVNAARAVAAHPGMAGLVHLPAFAVGDRSAAAAREAGFTTVASAGGALADLVRLVAGRLGRSGASVLYLAGQDRAGDLAGELAGHGFKVRTVVVYRTVAAGGLPLEAAQALAAGRIHGVLHYSRRSSEAFVAAATAEILNAAGSLTHYCLSADIAEPLRKQGAKHVIVAAHPEESALIELIGSA